MKRPKLGLALGAGGARGFAHVGVLEVLEEAGIPIDAISGSSMGSLVGGFYVTGMEIRYIKMLATNLKRKHWIDFTVPKMGIVAGDKIHEMIAFLTKGMNIEDANIPFSVVATDIEAAERVVYRSGPIHEAVRASISIPGVFVPHRYEDRLLVDGGVVDRVPISVCREMGVDIVVAVDVGLFDKTMPVRNMMDVFFQSIEIMEREILRTRMLDADFVIRPDVGHISSTNFMHVEECIDEGRRAAEQVVDQLRVLIDAWEGEPV